MGRSIGSTATIINAFGRVVVSTDPHRPTGSVLRADDLRAHLTSEVTGPTWLPDGRRMISCGDSSLSLVLE